MRTDTTDIVIIGAGAAGLAAGIFAGEAARGEVQVVVLEGSRFPGTKILASGGTRCNVTHESVRPEDYCGGPRPAIRNVLRAFDEQRTLEWMRQLGVELKLEPTGKYFPVTDSARTVLDGLLRRVGQVGVGLRTGIRVEDVRPEEGQFRLAIRGPEPSLVARRVIVATGGLSLPKSGSDGAGLRWMSRLGHTIVPTTPALAPLVLRPGREAGGRFAELAGLTIDVRLTVSDLAGKCLAEEEGPIVFTHFGISGPAAMNLSRHLARFRVEHPNEGARAQLTMAHPRFRSVEQAEAWLLEQSARFPKRTVPNVLTELYPERLARAMAGGEERLGELSRPRRQELARCLARLALNVEGDRGYSLAETTAGGVDLREVDVRTMQSRKVPGLYLCGEILDVDGRIGGFNFQWAWASGYLAGRAAVEAVREGR